MICAAKSSGRLQVGEHADHRADGVADEDGGALRELAHDLQHVVGVSLKRAVLRAVVGGQIRVAAADQIEEDDAVPRRVRRREEPPHVLIAAEAVREEHRRRAARPETCTLLRTRVVVIAADYNAASRTLLPRLSGQVEPILSDKRQQRR